MRYEVAIPAEVILVYEVEANCEEDAREMVLAGDVDLYETEILDLNTGEITVEGINE